MSCRFESLIRRAGLFSVVSVSIATSLYTTPVAAGDNNTLYVTQESGIGGLSNTLTVDQSGATGSVVTGTGGAATQIGGGNVGTITLTGADASVMFNQNNDNPGDGTNTAEITGGNLAEIVLNQDGYGNVGTLEIEGFNNSGSLTQNGNENLGTVKILGDASGTTAELIQNGDGNQYSLEAVGNSTSIQWTQHGNGNATSVPASVTTNAGTVIVTQTRY